MTDNTLRQVKHIDKYWLKQIINSAIDWYFMNCEEVTEIADFFGENESETFSDILTYGLREIQTRIDIMKEGNVKRGDEV